MSSENQMDQQNETAGMNEAETRSARRRFLKAGAAVVPVVITLQSGTAWAQSLTCAEKQEFPKVNKYNYNQLYWLLRKSGKSRYQAKYRPVSYEVRVKSYRTGPGCLKRG